MQLNDFARLACGSPTGRNPFPGASYRERREPSKRKACAKQPDASPAAISRVQAAGVARKANLADPARLDLLAGSDEAGRHDLQRLDALRATGACAQAVDQSASDMTAEAINTRGRNQPDMAHLLWSMIAFSRCGVTGSCVIAPGMPMASSIAEAIAAPTPFTPLSPAPLMPSGLSGDG